MRDRLFVYGTLKRGQESPLREMMSRLATFVSEATINGKLYKVSYYPGLFLSASAENVVHGEVFEVHDDELLHELDLYEGIDAALSTPYEYRREMVDVRLHDQSTARVWAYLYN
eukprot:CAMPEP_0174237604 /NCGR_PEP_ID=MMETSP0417-20130205/8701_1 /TAXON_ID=242541 /ORGANISM="Mayorella sp, Strain BSH-02190019" /LENGTH=113 /DNA_ID=CAMNT_0015316379 /DNA_START=55 /DNA_END=393 /DNA_ORIENTATION=+